MAGPSAPGERAPGPAGFLPFRALSLGDSGTAPGPVGSYPPEGDYPGGGACGGRPGPGAGRGGHRCSCRQLGVHRHGLRTAMPARVVVGRELDQPWAARLARYLRQRGGNSIVGKQKGMKGIMGHLRANHPVGLSSTRTPPLRAASWLTFSATRPGPPRWRRSWPGGGCRSCPPCPGAWRDGRHPHGDLAAVAPDKNLRPPGRHPASPGTPEPDHRGLGPDVPGTVALAPPALEKPVSGNL